MADKPAIDNPWQTLRQLTPARIALGRAGSSLTTRAQLDFQFAHAQARDAVHLALAIEPLAKRIQALGLECLSLHSAAADRQSYLQRPDLGRRLDEASAERLQAYAANHPNGFDLAIVIADGLSALAVERHALPLLEHIREQIQRENWTLAPITLVEQGRVAIADEIAETLKARMVVILLGERPGLSSPDSLGLYFTYAPKTGLNDASRNCISNIRQEGLGYPLAAHRLLYLLREACRRKLSGIQLKDEADMPVLDQATVQQRNFLLE
nr:ethanolamine ammonia-lyase subunit EutC [Azomonas macrocytogenes]